MKYRYKYCFTSSPTKPPSCTGPTIGDGSNHSGLAPSKFFRVLIEETVTAPVHLAKITAWKINIQTMTFQQSMKVDILTRVVTLSKNGFSPSVSLVNRSTPKKQIFPFRADLFFQRSYGYTEKQTGSHKDVCLCKSK